MNIDDFVFGALTTLQNIATNESYDAELRVNAAEKILDYAAKHGENQNITTEAIGFMTEEQPGYDDQDFGEQYDDLSDLK